MNPWVKFYEEVMGFRNILTFDDKDISTEYSALMSKVMSNGNGFVKFPINEPAEGKKKSQVEEYLDFYDGEGVQHIAMATNNIIETVTALQQRGLEFLKVPSTYYDTLLDRVGHIDEELNALKQLGILVDRDDEGYLLQIFSKPVRRSADTLFRDHSTQRREELRQRQFQSVVRSHRTRAGRERKFVVCHVERSALTSILCPRAERRIKRSASRSREHVFASSTKEERVRIDRIVKKGGSTMPYYQKLGEIPRKHHIWFHRNGAGPGYKNEGIYYEHVVTTEGFNEAFSIMYHLRPPTRVRNVKLLKCEELKKATDSPLRHHHLKTANIPRKGRSLHRPHSDFV